MPLKKHPLLLALAASFSIALWAQAPEPVAAEDPYADEPYWYRPGHPSNPAEPADISVLPGFVAERVVAVPPGFGSWTALCAAPQGKLIAAAQHQAGLYRITPADPDDPSSQSSVEPMGGVARTVGWCQGLLYAHDSLYVTIAEENPDRPTGIYRLTDTNGDDTFDKIELLFELEGSGEHGPHNLVAHPQDGHLYLMCGNHTEVPPTELPALPVSTEGLDRLLPPGFNSSTHSTAGFVLRFAPDGSQRQVFASGLRNSYDLAFNANHELFTFDSDMEWDLGAPWYRPTRINHIVSGSEFGWREDGAVWPEHFEDASAPVLNVGPSSPTGIVFGYQARFPKRYQNALFVGDWTFAAIYAVHLDEQGASYRGSFEEFLGGSGLPITDIIVAEDGHLYFTVGGRRLGSALYRVRYVGEEPVTPYKTETATTPSLRDLRRQIEHLHSSPRPDRLDFIWQHLGHSDRAIRFAARVALEKLPPNLWTERANQETDTDTQLTALLALARQAPGEDLEAVIQSCAAFDLESLTAAQTLRHLRVCELALARSYGEAGADAPELKARLRSVFPNTNRQVTYELARLLGYLGDESLIEPALDLMRADTGQRSASGLDFYARNPKYGQAIRDMLESAPLLDRMHFAQMLLWIEDGWSDAQRLDYFQLIADATQSSKGGHWYQDFWNQIRETALQQVDAPLREAIVETVSNVRSQADQALPDPIGPGRDWTLDAAMKAFAENQQPRDLEAGKRAFAAASCVSCHRMGADGTSIGPDLSSVGQRFTPRDILEATLDPNRAVSDQYRMTVVTTRDGTTYSGRVIARDKQSLRLATNLLRPSQSTTLPLDTIASEQALPVSTMPSGLLDSLNEDELLDLLAYLVSGGDPSHTLYKNE